MKRILKSFFLIINYKTLIVTALSVISTYLCFNLGLTAKFPDMLVGVAIVFPVVFSIGSAYTRRETALQRFSDFKGHAIAIYYASRDWTTEKDGEVSVRYSQLFRDIMLQLKDMLKGNTKQWREKEKVMFDKFSSLSRLTIELRSLGVQSSEVSRINQYISKMIIAFDNMKLVHLYPTQVTLIMYSKIFIYEFPISHSTYSASAVKDYSASLEYVMPILY